MRPNITSSFEKPKTKPSAWSISTHVDVVAELLGQPGRQLQATEPGTQHDDSHALTCSGYSCWISLRAISVDGVVELVDALPMTTNVASRSGIRYTTEL